MTSISSRRWAEEGDQRKGNPHYQIVDQSEMSNANCSKMKEEPPPLKEIDENNVEDDVSGGGFWCCGKGITNDQEGNEIFHLQKEARVWPMVMISLTLVAKIS